MKMMLISDNHGRWNQTYNIIKNVRPNVDFVFHLGDSEFPKDDVIWELVDGVVEGNMDHPFLYPEEKVVETEKGKVLLVHGHRLNVNRSNDAVLDLAKERGAKYAFHGHTHRLSSEVKDGVLLVNPGSISNPRGIYGGTTYAIVDVNDDSTQVAYYDEDMNLVDDLTQTYYPN